MCTLIETSNLTGWDANLPRSHCLNSQLIDENQPDVSNFLISVQNLLHKYKMYSKSQDSTVASGGLQQFITQKIRKSDTSFNLMKKLRALYGQSESTVPLPFDKADEPNLFGFLPVDLKLYIFSFLDAKSLCMACCVNQEWSQLTCDNLLWQHRLECDWKSWSTITHLTNPQMYIDIECEWSTKEIYLKCSPEFQRQLHQANSTFHQVSSVLKSFIPKKIPKVAMFGPGLEQSTSGLVRKMLYEDNEKFKRVAMFPGQFDGLGGGMTLKFCVGHSVHLSVLYSASKQERENRGDQNRLNQNKMLQGMGSMGADGKPEYELTPQLKDFCKTLDAFICVIDASETQETIENARPELEAMIREQKSTSQTPLLILSCIKDNSKHRLPASDIVSMLKLSAVSQPWMVIDCVTDTLDAVDTGMVWMVDQAQYK